MAAGSPEFYFSYLEGQWDGTYDWENDNHYAVLLSSSHSFTGTHSTLNDIVANEIGDGDYNPQDLATEAITEAAGVVTIDAAQVDFGSAVTITARHIAVCVGTVAGKATSDPLVFSAALDDTADKSSTADDFKVDWNASGIATFTQTTP